MQGNNLMSDDVVTSLQVLWDGDSGGEVGVDEVVGGPGSGAARSDQTSLRDLAPAKRAGSQGRAITCPLSEMFALLSVSYSYRCMVRCS